MAKSRTFLVSFTPATLRDGVVSFIISDMIGRPKHTVEAATYGDLRKEVLRLARLEGRTVIPTIAVPKGERNPPGFKKEFGSWNCIEFVPEAVAA